jgi:hypothetical protein
MGESPCTGAGINVRDSTLRDLHAVTSPQDVAHDRHIAFVAAYGDTTNSTLRERYDEASSGRAAGGRGAGGCGAEARVRGRADCGRGLAGAAALPRRRGRTVPAVPAADTAA